MIRKSPAHSIAFFQEGHQYQLTQCMFPFWHRNHTLSPHHTHLSEIELILFRHGIKFLRDILTIAR